MMFITGSRRREPACHRHHAGRLWRNPLMIKPFAILTVLTLASAAYPAELLFQDDFKGRLGQEWSWVREHREGWRVTDRGLEVRVEPGNMWGGQNNARNVLVRPAPSHASGELEVSVAVENKPSNQYEQVNLVWYYDDRNMVKLGLELVDGKLSIVMGREEQDRCRTIGIRPVDAGSVRVRFFVNVREIRGEFLTPDGENWREMGRCTLPAPASVSPKISLQFYQGPENVEHWARVTEFRVLKHP